MSKVVNFDKFKPFADAVEGDESAVQDGMVHIPETPEVGGQIMPAILLHTAPPSFCTMRRLCIQIQQRNGRDSPNIILRKLSKI